MRIIFFLIAMALLVSCVPATKPESQEQVQNDSVETVTTNTATTEAEIPDFEIGLQFVEEYIKYISTSQDLVKIDEWLQGHPLLTQNFKDTYKKIVEEANRKDPEMGLNYDPIIKGQDFPETGFFIEEKNAESGYLTIKSSEDKYFDVKIKLVSENGKWLVDGAGVVNITEKAQVEHKISN